MSIYRKNPKRDLNEAEIINALRCAGASVHQVSGTGMPDLLIGFRGKTYLGEVKSKKGTLTTYQKKFMDEWRGFPIMIFRSVDEAIEWCNSPAARGL